MPEMHSELPLAVKQLLDIHEQPSEYETTDWKDKPSSFANKSLEERNILTKTPVVIQHFVEQEKEVGWCFA